MLSLDVEFLLGVCFAARSPSSRSPDWPPQPDRLFSALVATWASRGESEMEKAALEWLEAQTPPSILASKANGRSAPSVFVPPNDMGSDQISALPNHRSRKDRCFPAAVPDNPVATYCWDGASPNAQVTEALQALARDMVYLGHSSSLIRCNFRAATTSSDDRTLVRSKLGVYVGRFAELRQRYEAGKRPLSGAHVNEELSPTAIETPATSVFGSEWYVFVHASGDRPDLRNAAVACRAFRTAILSGFDGGAIPEVISGHTIEGAPSSNPHLAIFPLANVGWKFADGHLMGLALCLPASATKDDQMALARSLARIIRDRGDPEYFEVNIGLPGGGAWRVRRQVEPQNLSLQPGRYQRASRVWATVTPIALDRHPKANDPEALQEEVARTIGAACTRIGLPEPELVVADKHSAVAGSISARPSGRAPAWTQWSRPASLSGRPLTHATIVFKNPVRGPVCLGAGRFFGLGLCLPIERTEAQ